MNFNALQSLVRVDEVQSFSKAADIENMTLSALSMQMKALEETLKIPLFDRNFRPPKLTPMGKTVAQQARHVLQAKQALLDVCADTSGLSGRFRLGFIQSASVRIMPSFLRLARARYAQAEFRLSSNLSEDLTEQVKLGALDAAVVTRVGVPRTELHFNALGTEAMTFATPSEHRDTPLDQMPFVLPFLHFRPSSGIGQLIEQTVTERFATPTEIIVLDSIEACMECVKEGLGYTALPLPDIERCSDSRVHIHATSAHRMTRELALVVRRENATVIWRKVLCDTLKECFEMTSKTTKMYGFAE